MRHIFKYFTIDDRSSLVYTAWFTDSFGVEEFDGYDRMLYLFLQYCSRLNIPAERRYLTVFLETEGKRLMKEHGVRTDSIANLSYNEPSQYEEAFRIISKATLTTFDEYVKEDLTDRLFKVDMNSFLERRRRERFQKLMMDTYSSTVNQSCSDDVMINHMTMCEHIQYTYDPIILDDLDFLLGEHGTSYIEKDKMRFLVKTGLPCFDGDMGGIFTKMLIAESASPGAGKTRLSLVHFAYPMLLAKMDVLYDELELTEGEVRNILVAHHIVYMFDGKVKIPDKLATYDSMDEEQARYFELARQDLFESGKYGKLHIRKELNVETMYSKTLTFLRLHPEVQMWIIDYAGMIGSTGKGHKFYKDQASIIDDAYKITKRVLKKADISGVILNQFTKEGVEAALLGKPIIPGYIQGGQTIQRNADYEIVMTRTEQQKVANYCSMSSNKERAATGFKNVSFSTDLAVSIFRQERQENTN